MLLAYSSSTRPSPSLYCPSVHYFIMTFFNAATVHSAALRMQGGNPNVMTGLKGVMSRLPQIFGWALVAATVGFVL